MKSIVLGLLDAEHTVPPSVAHFARVGIRVDSRSGSLQKMGKVRVTAGIELSRKLAFEHMSFAVSLKTGLRRP